MRKIVFYILNTELGDVRVNSSVPLILLNYLVQRNIHKTVKIEHIDNSGVLIYFDQVLEHSNN